MIPGRILNADPVPLGAPRDWKEDAHGRCVGLFIRREQLNGVDFMRSAWEAEENEGGTEREGRAGGQDEETHGKFPLL